ncbi:MAG TPA: TIGR04283 family arsenosugar biosynthesis glycosyltransferase [Pseudolabrys sp.]|nr:TIGR04283 family arsenosugar biosynthesis glycosyltransferase [Pseudolabrys sp.]
MTGAPLSIIVPVLNEATRIEAALAALAPLRARGAEVIVVDGGSVDATPGIARPLADRVVTSRRGRAVQMNAGAAVARGDILLFLHADTQLPAEADGILREGLAVSGRSWGRFDVHFGEGPLLGVIAVMMNLRSRITGIATGDQAIFVTRGAFEAVGGFPPIELMEDIAISTRLRRLSRPLCLRARVRTSPRRWKENGTLRTVFLMWRLRLAYFLGADPRRLAQRYGYVPAEQ